MRRAGWCAVTLILLTTHLCAAPSATQDARDELEIRGRVVAYLADAGTSALDFVVSLLADGRRADAVGALGDCVSLSGALVAAGEAHLSMLPPGGEVPRGLEEFSQAMKVLGKEIEEGATPAYRGKGSGPAERLQNIWDMLVPAVLGQAELVRFLLLTEQGVAGEKAVGELDDLISVLKRWAWRVETEASHRGEIIKRNVDGGWIDDARANLTEMEALLDLGNRAQLRLAAVMAVRKGVREPVPQEPAPEEDETLHSKFYGGRASRRGLLRNGGGESTELAVELGLQWLAKHQDEDGLWDCDGFMSEDTVPSICDGAGSPLYDTGVTGLALLAFLGAGHDSQSGEYKEVVKKGLTALKMMQDSEGCFGARTMTHFTYNHAVATRAMAEAYAMTGSIRYRQSAQKGVDFIERCRNPYLAWRYGVRPHDNDTSVSGWMFCALKAAEAAGLRIAPGSHAGMEAWLKKATEPEFGRVGYTSRGTGPARPQEFMDDFPADKSESLTAAGILSRILIGERPDENLIIQKGTDLCLKALPEWDERSGSIDMYYWYYGTEAMFQMGGDAWRKWNAALKRALLRNQRMDGAFRGSWDPLGPWGSKGGRVYSTTLCVLALETYYRTGRLFE